MAVVADHDADNMLAGLARFRWQFKTGRAGRDRAGRSGWQFMLPDEFAVEKYLRHACAARATHELELVATAARSDSQVSDCHGAGTITGRSAKCSTWYESAPAKAVS